MAIFLPPPPRVDLHTQGDSREVLNYQWEFFKALALNAHVLIEAEQFATPTFDGTTLPTPTDPAATTVASAQLVANTAYTLAVATLTGSRNGQATIAGAAGSVVVTFTTPLADNNYRLVASASAFAGAPAAGAFTVVALAKTAAGFTLAVLAVPGVGASVTYDYLVVR